MSIPTHSSRPGVRPLADLEEDSWGDLWLPWGDLRLCSYYHLEPTGGAGFGFGAHWIPQEPIGGGLLGSIAAVLILGVIHAANMYYG